MSVNSDFKILFDIQYYKMWVKNQMKRFVDFWVE